MAHILTEAEAHAYKQHEHWIDDDGTLVCADCAYTTNHPDDIRVHFNYLVRRLEDAQVVIDGIRSKLTTIVDELEA
jgi:hypothetical protein